MLHRLRRQYGNLTNRHRCRISHMLAAAASAVGMPFGFQYKKTTCLRFERLFDHYIHTVLYI